MVALSLLPAGGQEVPTNRPKSDRIDVRAAHSIALPTDGKTACEQQADLQLKGALMPKLRVHSFAISVDGYGAGPRPRPRQSTWRRRRCAARMGLRNTHFSTDVWPRWRNNGR